ncbi:glycoside hydrolase family 19 protein [Burkholderia lata]|uniref:Glycoside hydrolase family protein n=1 Tax=Burkholderia lata (strain ATCC 17760 / DSM 23089 / LMG 22485 / NCIMB 9086 / R18194 / 383) TaxID=482957 RepID=A0A6P2GQP1_BURL3|nr:glycoside hydrolase family 19 protein [Burkholderia lata]VWB06803.1 glycoside hydrolase family protein [Burkholderia lata]
MNLTPQIIAAGTGCTLPRASQWLAPMQAACDKYEINTPLRVSAFLATYGVESQYLTALSEDMYYSATRLMAIFPREFPNQALASQYAGQPEKLANFVYANRNGNGDVATGDGWSFRARGAGLTGRTLYQLIVMGIDLDVIAHPELLEQPENAAMASTWCWSNRNMNKLADAGNFLGISKAWNLGSANNPGTPVGWAQRRSLYTAGKSAFGI